MAIIICPNCKCEVSSLAPLCPHCGVKINNNIGTCPECGTNYLINNATVCKRCGIVLNGENTSVDNAASIAPIKSEKPAIAPTNETFGVNRTYNKDAPPVSEPQMAPEPETPKKKNKFKGCLIGCLVAVILFLVASAIGVYLYISHTKEVNEKKDYSELMQNFTIDGAEKFLDEYPDSKHRSVVSDKLNQHKHLADEWNNISRTSNIDELISFKERFPGSPYEAIVDKKIDSLNNLKRAYGNYSDDIEETEKSRIEEVMFRYFAALSDNNPEMLKEVCNSQVYNKSCAFINNKDLTQIVNYSITSPINITPNTLGGDAGYNVSCTILRTNEDENGIKTHNTYNIEATLNSLKQITTLMMK